MYAPLPIREIQQAASDPAFVEAADALFRALDETIAARRPECTNRGACCRFGEYGHDLFVTAVELAFFLARAQTTLLAPPDRSHCPYQHGGVCSVRAARPAGCRIFFCDPAAQDWQPGQTEETLRALAELGERFGIPYAYLEWTDALRRLGGRIVSCPADREAVQLGIDIDADRS